MPAHGQALVGALDLGGTGIGRNAQNLMEIDGRHLDILIVTHHRRCDDVASGWYFLAWQGDSARMLVVLASVLPAFVQAFDTPIFVGDFESDCKSP